MMIKSKHNLNVQANYEAMFLCPSPATPPPNPNPNKEKLQQKFGWPYIGKYKECALNSESL
jgi:hypothetical protein